MASGLTAFIAPEQISDFLERSFVYQLLPIPMSVFLLIIGVNNLSMSILTLLANKYQKYIFAWATIWLAGVMVVINRPVGISEHFGFFAMALALWINATSNVNEVSLKIIRIGLSLLFFANGLAALFYMPQELTEILNESFLSKLLPIPMDIFLIIIGINDVSIGILLALLVNKYQKYIFAWATIWLAGVMLIGEPLLSLEHFGFFAMALALWINAASTQKDLT